MILVSLSLVVAAQAAPPAAAESGLTSYPAAFFADKRPSTALDLVVNIPGFGLSSGSSVRGYAGSAGNVLIDGARPTSKSDTVDEVLRRIPASAVERIDVIRGGAPGIDMQGQAVVANVIRKRVASTSRTTIVGAQYSAGQLSPNARFEGARQAPGRSVDGSLELNRNINANDDGRRTSFTPEGRPFLLRRSRFENRSTGVEGAARGDLKLGEASTLRGNINFEARGGSGQGGSTLASEAGEPRGSDQFDSESRNGKLELGGEWDRKLGPRTNFKVIGSQRLEPQRSASNFANASRSSASERQSLAGESILRSSLALRRSPTLSFEAGAEGAFNFLDESFQLSVGGAPVELPSQDLLVAERRAEVFAQAAWKPRPRWTLDAGARVEASRLSQTGDTEKASTFVFPKPRLLVSYAPDAQTQLRLRLERTVGQLRFSDFVSSASLETLRVEAGNPNLEPERATVAGVNFERRFWSKGALNIGASHSEIDGAIDRIPIFGPGFAFDAPGNIGRGRSDVISASLTLPTDKLRVPGGTVRLSGARTWSEVTDPVTGEQRPLSNRSPYFVSGGFSQDIKRWRTSWSLNAAYSPGAASFAIDEIDEFEIGPSIFASVEYKPSPRWGISLNASPPGDDFIFRRTVFAGPRDRNPVSFIEENRSSRPGSINVRLRRTG